jgi:hypothetical protein
MNPRATLNKLENMFGDFGTFCCANGGLADGGMLKIWERSAEIPTSQTIPIHGHHTVRHQGVSPMMEQSPSQIEASRLADQCCLASWVDHEMMIVQYWTGSVFFVAETVRVRAATAIVWVVIPIAI